MKSMPPSPARGASRRQSGQLADQRSGTLVAERPDEQLAPKMPILRALELYIATRSRIDTGRSNKTFSIRFLVRSANTQHGSAQHNSGLPSVWRLRLRPDQSYCGRRYGPSSFTAASTNE